MSFIDLILFIAGFLAYLAAGMLGLMLCSDLSDRCRFPVVVPRGLIPGLLTWVLWPFSLLMWASSVILGERRRREWWR